MMKSGLLGYPLSHSFSKKLFQCLRNNFGLLIEYENFSIPPEQIKEFFNFALKHLDGFNITVPYKEEPFKFEYFEILEPAKTIGAVNVVKKESGRFLAFNTDYIGFIQPIKNLAFRKVLVFGAGGAARAVIFALIKHGAEKIFVFNRTEERARRLQRTFEKIEVIGSEQIKDALEESELVVNATSLGLHGESFTPLKNVTPEGDWFDKIFYDLIYNPPVTDFLKIGEKFGATTINGLKMLLFQAIENIKIWTGENYTTEVFECSEFLQQVNPTENI